MHPHPRISVCRKLAIALLLPFLSGLAIAQEPDAAAPVYQVEIIVFRNLDQSATTPEQPRAAGRTEEDMDIEEFTDSALSQSDALDEAELFEFVAEEDLQLGRVYKRLTDLSAYQPIYHVGWRQTAIEGDLLPLKLEQISDVPANISGDVTLYRQRYVHLRVAVDVLDASVSVAGGGGFWESLRNSQPAAYAISGTRRVRSNRLMYFDHPEYGIVASVSRLETETESES
ncbi:MAG: CsiV family protein [Gammaproteobacteria bacterium]